MSFEKYNINPEFSDLFSFKSEKDELKHDAKILMYRFLSEIERMNEGNRLQKKDFASALKTSRSFITQLFKGDKIASLYTIAKLQKAFNVTFKIEAEHENSNNYYEMPEYETNKTSTAKVIAINYKYQIAQKV